MKFTASSAELLKALSTVNGAVPTKSPLPILESILFSQEGEQLRLTASDLEVTIVQLVPVNFGSDLAGGKVAVPARRLLDTLRALPDLPIEFSADADFNVRLRTEQGEYKMVGFDGADYPALPESTEGIQIETSAQILKRAIVKTSFAVSNDGLRPAMQGIYFQIGPDEGRAVATDGHRLVKLRLTGLTSPDQTSFIIPEKALALTARIAGSDACVIHVSEKYVGFDFGATRVKAVLIAESYPNYEAVIPVENDRRLMVNRDALLSAVRRVGLYSSSMTNQIRLSVSENRVEISAEDIERSSEARETVLAEYDAEPMVIGFNSVYLLEVLNNVDGDDVVFEFSSPNRAGVVTPAEQANGEDILMLIMPVMLNTYA